MPGKSWNLLQKFWGNSCPLRALAQKQHRKDDLDGSACEFSTGDAMQTSPDDNEGLAHLGSYGDYNILSLATMPPRYFEREEFGEFGFFSQRNSENSEECCDYLSDVPFRGASSLQSFAGGRTLTLRVRTPHGNFLKPLNSIESCLTAHLYEYFNLEQYVVKLMPFPSIQAVGPSLVTYGGQVIRKPCSNILWKTQVGGVEIGMTLGNPLLPKGSMKIPKKLKQSSGKQRPRRTNSSRVSEGSYHSHGSLDRILFFLLGITTGMVYAIDANKREVDKLNQLLKQKESLVQDLHEELRVLNDKDIDTIGLHQQVLCDGVPSELLSQEYLNYSRECDGQHPNNVMGEESISILEAELEAELQRLEVDMKESSLKRISDYVELDPSFVPDVVHGELGLNKQPGNWFGSDHEVSGNSTHRVEDANYAVSPKELSLRLYAVIQSRLEERIAELEMTLGNIQKRGLCSDGGSSSTLESPPVLDQDSAEEGPLAMNLKGETFDAFGMVYEEVIGAPSKLDEDGLNPLFIEKESSCNEVPSWEELSSESWGLNEAGESDDDEMGKLLIKQIVEKVRRGSPAALTSKKVLSLMGDP